MIIKKKKKTFFFHCPFRHCATSISIRPRVALERPPSENQPTSLWIWLWEHPWLWWEMTTRQDGVRWSGWKCCPAHESSYNLHKLRWRGYLDWMQREEKKKGGESRNEDWGIIQAKHHSHIHPARGYLWLEHTWPRRLSHQWSRVPVRIRWLRSPFPWSTRRVECTSETVGFS